MTLPPDSSNFVVEKLVGYVEEHAGQKLDIGVSMSSNTYFMFVRLHGENAMLALIPMFSAGSILYDMVRAFTEATGEKPDWFVP